MSQEITIPLSRRRFLHGTALVASLVGISGSGFAAGESPIEDVVFGGNASVSAFDPYLTTDVVDQIVFFNLFDCPTRILPDGTVVPGLALAWDAPDDRTWVLKLRQDVVWHNGDPFTADDIVFSLGRVVDPNSRSIFKGTFSAIEKVTARDEHTLEIVTKNPDPFMPKILGNYGAHVLPKKYLESVGEQGFLDAPIGTGPYKVKDFVPGQTVVLVRNEQYWDLAAVRSVTIRRIPEMSARTAALLTGEVHLINGISPDGVAQISTDDTRAVTTPSGSAFFLPINMHTAPLNNRDVRHAFSLAIDRQAIITHLFNGQAEALKEAILPGSVGADPKRPSLAHDPDQARSLLKGAGYAGEEIVFECMANAYFGNDRVVGEALVAMWRDVGLNVRLNVLEPAVRAQKNTARAFEGLFAAYFAQHYGDAAGLMWRALNAKGILSHYWNVPEVATARTTFNELGTRAVQLFDDRERAKLYQKMSDIMLDAMPWILLFQPSMIYGASNSIEIAPGPNFIFDMRKRGLSPA